MKKSDPLFAAYCGRLSDFIHRSSSLSTDGASPLAHDTEFETLALELFTLQFQHNAAYQTLCRARSLNPDLIKASSQIPAVPAVAFKEMEMTSLAPEERTAVFFSSGTTEQRPSRHFHCSTSLSIYEKSLKPWYHLQFLQGRAEKVRHLFLTPPAAQVPNSSLVHMFDTVATHFGTADSTFLGRVGDDHAWTLDIDRAFHTLREATAAGHPIVLLGTAFSFVHLLDECITRNERLALPAGTRVLETGGYKGRSRTMPKTELHALITQWLGVPSEEIICEYGMSELSSQAYDTPPHERSSSALRIGHIQRLRHPGGVKDGSRGLIPLRAGDTPGNGPVDSPDPEGVAQISFPDPQTKSVTAPLEEREGERRGASPLPHVPLSQSVSPPRLFQFPPWARVQLISPETGRPVNPGETGLIRIYDLANVFSVMAIQTEDLGIQHEGGFELIGRAAAAEARGCSLMAS